MCYTDRSYENLGKGVRGKWKGMVKVKGSGEQRIMKGKMVKDWEGKERKGMEWKGKERNKMG